MRLSKSTLIVPILLVVAIGARGAEADAPQQAVLNYQGTFGGDSKAILRVDGPLARGAEGTFTARHIEMLCDDHTRDRGSLDPIPVKFTNAREFRGERYYVDFHSYTQWIQIVEGQVSRDGERVRGHLIAIDDESGPESVDCGTRGRSRWRAELRGSGRQ